MLEANNDKKLKEDNINNDPYNLDDIINIEILKFSNHFPTKKMIRSKDIKKKRFGSVKDDNRKSVDV